MNHTIAHLMWNTNATLPEIAERLRAARRILVLTHLKPDGDAVGSTLAVVRALNQPSAWTSSSTPKAKVWYYGPPPPWLSELAADTPYRLVTRDQPPPLLDADPSAEPDLILILDTGSWNQLEPIAEWLSPRRERGIIVDHHAQGDDDVAPTKYIDVASAAVCQPAAELCRLVLGLESIAALPAPVANALYLGLATDTGWFRHSNVSPTVMQTAAELLRAGANHARLYHMSEQNSLGRLLLIGRALNTLELACDGRLAVMSITKKDMEECHAAPGDTGGITDYSQSLGSVRVSAMLSEASPADFGLANDGRPFTKISLRSKAVAPAVDVNVIAKDFGGGGHVRASGARLDADIETTKKRIIELVNAQITGTVQPRSPL